MTRLNLMKISMENMLENLQLKEYIIFYIKHLSNSKMKKESLLSQAVILSFVCFKEPGKKITVSTKILSVF